jgi:hypothetical protein
LHQVQILVWILRCRYTKHAFLTSETMLCSLHFNSLKSTLNLKSWTQGSGWTN